jgi:hypothetical protein
MKNNDLHNIEKEIQVLKKSINEMMEKASISNRLKTGILGAATMLVPSMRSENSISQPKTEIQAPKTEIQAPKTEVQTSKQSHFFPPDSEYSVHEQKNKPPLLSPEHKTQMAKNPLKPGEILKNYQDPRHLPIEEHFEQKYNLPHRSVTALRVAGELSNWNDVSKAGARGTYQFMPGTRKSFLDTYGVDAYKDTMSAAHAAALHLRDNIRRVKVYANRNDKRIQGIPAETDADKWRLAVKMYNATPETIKKGNSIENNDYAHRIEHGLKILQDNPDIYHLDHIIQEKRHEDVVNKQQAKMPNLKILNPTKKSLLKTRGNLVFPNILPKNSRPEQNVKQLFDPKYQTKYFPKETIQSHSGVYLMEPDKSFSFDPEKNETISAHEGMHQTISNIAKKINNKDRSVYAKLNSLIPTNQKNQISHFLLNSGLYSGSESISQEILPWLHTILHDKESRDAFLNHHYPINDKNQNISWDKVSEKNLNTINHPNLKNGRMAIQKLNRSWKNIRYFAKKAKEEDIKSNHDLDQREP